MIMSVTLKYFVWEGHVNDINWSLFYWSPSPQRKNGNVDLDGNWTQNLKDQADFVQLTSLPIYYLNNNYNNNKNDNYDDDNDLEW